MYTFNNRKYNIGEKKMLDEIEKSTRTTFLIDYEKLCMNLDRKQMGIHKLYWISVQWTNVTDSIEISGNEFCWKLSDLILMVVRCSQ